MDRVPDVLRRGHDDGEDDEENDGVAMVEAIDDVVIVSHVDLGDAANSADQTARHHRSDSSGSRRSGSGNSSNNSSSSRNGRKTQDLTSVTPSRHLPEDVGCVSSC